MRTKRIIAALVSVLALSGVVGANLANAGSEPAPKASHEAEEPNGEEPDTDDVQEEVGDQSEGPEADAQEKTPPEAA